MKQEELELFVSWAHEAGKSGLIRCSSGNLSQRLLDGSMLISATGSWLPSLSIDQVSKISVFGDNLLSGVKPSAEFRLHQEIMRLRPDINTILHFQAPSATAIACMEIHPDYNVIIEVPVYIGEIGHVPFLLPGSAELAEAVAAQMVNVNLVQMANHGQVVCGKDYQDVYLKAVFFEFACSILLNTGFKTSAIPAGYISELKAYTHRNA